MSDKLEFNCKHKPNEGACAHCFVEAHEIIDSFIAAFRAYEIDVDTEPTHKHRAMMDRAVAFVTPSTQIRRHT